MNKIRAGFFAFTELAKDADHVEYNHWHSTDHIAENLAIPGIVLGARWAAPKAYMAARGETIARLRPNQYFGQYLAADPLVQTLDEFREVGRRTRVLGRFFKPRTILGAAWFRLLKTFTAPGLVISAEALPFRPSPGIYMELALMPPFPESQQINRWYDEVYVPRLLGVKGVLGAYWFNGSLPAESTSLEEAENMHVWVYYLDEDPLRVARSIQAAAGEVKGKPPLIRPVFSGPYESILNPLHYDYHAR